MTKEDLNAAFILAVEEHHKECKRHTVFEKISMDFNKDCFYIISLKFDTPQGEFILPIEDYYTEENIIEKIIYNLNIMDTILFQTKLMKILQEEIPY